MGWAEKRIKERPDRALPLSAVRGSVMLEVLILLLPVFVLIFLGMLAERFQLVPPFGATTLNQFLVNLGLPSLIFLAIAECRPEDLNHEAFLGGFSVCLFVTFGLLIPIFHRFLRAGYRESVMLSMLASFPNVVLVGLPVLMALYPGEKLVVLASTLTNILEIPIILVALLILTNDGAKGRHPVRTVAVTLITNPVVLSTAFGALFYLSGMPVPVFLESACRALGNSVMPCALVSLGIVMGARLRGGQGGVSGLADRRLFSSANSLFSRPLPGLRLQCSERRLCGVPWAFCLRPCP